MNIQGAKVVYNSRELSELEKHISVTLLVGAAVPEPPAVDDGVLLFRPEVWRHGRLNSGDHMGVHSWRLAQIK